MGNSDGGNSRWFSRKTHS